MQERAFLVGMNGGEEKNHIDFTLFLQFLHQTQDLRVGLLLAEVHEHQLADILLHQRLQTLRMVRVLFDKKTAFLC